MVDRPPLRLVPPAGQEDNSLFQGQLEASLRLLQCDRGALIRRTGADAPIEVTSRGLSPEEEAACRDLTRRAWKQAGRRDHLPGRLGDLTLLARPLEVGAGEAALVAAMRNRGGRVDAERLVALDDVSVLLEHALQAALAAERTAAQLAEERRYRDRLLALNHAFQGMADADDIEPACHRLLEELAPQFEGVDALSVWLLEADGKSLRRVAAISSGIALPPELVMVKRGDDLDGAIRGGEPRLINYARGGRTRAAREARKAGIAATLHVPLRSRNNVTGMLMLSSGNERLYTADDRAFLNTLAAQLGGQLDAIRERDRTEAEWQRLRTLLETLPVGIALLDAAGKVVLWNRAVEAIWGHAPLDVGVDRFVEAYGLLTPEGRPPTENPIERLLLDRQPETGREFVVRQPDGTEKPVIFTAAPIHDPLGRLSGVVAVFQDITPLREVDRLKDSFISSVSHELRTPTTTVRGGALTLLKRGDQLEPETRRQLLQDIAEEAERLYHLVEDLLVLSRLQAGMMLQTEPLIMHRFVNKVILELGQHIGNHALSVNVPIDLPLVDADPACSEQVLRNLLENAVKFSPRTGRIEITAEAQGRFVRFTVLDRGSGIPKADMDRVFEPFYKTADAVRTGSQGAGLGLAVCRRLVEVQGGRIWAEPRPGGGTAFRFTLPAIPEDEE